MRATTILMNEHRLIEQVLTCLERMADKATADGRLEAAPARDAVAFFREFADGCHHAKEEDRLFPMMESRGFRPDAGPTAVMRHEHVRGRELVDRLADAINGAAEGNSAEICRFVDTTANYAELLREHIGKEDHCLFPMADQALGAEGQSELLESFSALDSTEMGDAAREKFHKIANDLADRYGVPRVELTTEDATCSET